MNESIINIEDKIKKIKTLSKKTLDKLPNNIEDLTKKEEHKIDK